MGAWGYGIFENDFACDVRDRFNKYMKKGMKGLEASKQCTDEYCEFMDDVHFVLAIAELQMKANCLQLEIKSRCLRMIEEKKDINTWNDPERRVKVLESFKEKLLRH